MAEISSPWAYTENASEKRKTNIQIYKELREKYKIATSTRKYNIELKIFEDINQDEFDVIIECAGHGYAHTKYRVIKNAPKLSQKELALICDDGNLCFGYRTEGSLIVIHTD